jgi:hypothetical protein
MSLTAGQALARIAELQELHDTTGASTIFHINAVLAELSLEDILEVGQRMKALGITRAILSGRSHRKLDAARKADNTANTVVYGKNAVVDSANIN